jgi:hypothetical protein
MSLSDSQLAAIRSGEEGHALRIAELSARIRRAQEEIAVHEALLDFIRSDQVLALLADLNDSDALAVTIAEDPFDFIRDRQLPLPEGMALNAVEFAADPNARLIAYFSYGSWNLEAIWDREGGIYSNVRERSHAKSDI